MSPSPRIGMRRPSRIQSNRISKTPSRSGPMNVFGRITTTSSPRRPNSPRAAPPRSSTRRTSRPRRGVVLVDRVALRDAVDGGGRDQHDAPHARLQRRREHGCRALDVDRADRTHATTGSGAPPQRARRRLRPPPEPRARSLRSRGPRPGAPRRRARARGRRAGRRRACARSRRRRGRAVRGGARESRRRRRSRPASRGETTARRSPAPQSPESRWPASLPAEPR